MILCKALNICQKGRLLLKITMPHVQLNTAYLFQKSTYKTEILKSKQSEDKMRKIWRNADCVTFDVDSTVCIDEAIDEMADFFDVGEQVSELTKEAMAGKLSYFESLSRRLDLINPTQEGLLQFMGENPPRLTPGIIELVDLLHSRNVPVYLISGGFYEVIQNVGDILRIPRRNIYSNRLKFYFDGTYAGFDENQETCYEGGKPSVIQHLIDTHGYKCVVHVGDGSTDVEAKPPASGFIGFGGNQVRTSVKKASNWFVYSFQELIDEFKSSNGYDNLL